jgi:hypothetical protein
MPVVALSSGCATTQLAKAPKGMPAQVFAFWHKDIEFLPDSMNNGRMTPALCGRVWLFDGGQTGPAPITADGSLVVSLYTDPSRTNADGTPVPLEVWQITPDCMNRVVLKDRWGWGYTLNLPWNTYRPDISTVRLQVEYLPPKDAKNPMPVFSDSPMLALQHPGSTTQGVAKNKANDPTAPQQNVSGYMPGAVQPASATLQGTLPVNRITPPAAPSFNAANLQPALPPSCPVPLTPEAPKPADNAPVLTPVSGVGGPGLVQPAIAPAPGALQMAPRSPQMVPPTNSTPQTVPPANSAPAQTTMPLSGPAPQGPPTAMPTPSSPPPQTTVLGNGPLPCPPPSTGDSCAPPQVQTISTLARTPPSVSAPPTACLPLRLRGEGDKPQMPVTDNHLQGPAPISNSGVQPLGPALDSGAPSAMQPSASLPAPVQTNPSNVAVPPPPANLPAPAVDARAGASGSAGVMPRDSMPSQGQMLVIPSAKPQ